MFACQERKTLKKSRKENDVVTMNQMTTDYYTLIHQVTNDGNEDAYNELFYSFMDSNKAERTDSLMIYSKIMAEKFKYEKAYFDYFKALCEKHNIDIDYPNYSSIDISSMEKLPNKEAINWLNKMKNEKIITIEQYNSIKK
jgi:hypothetical protein